MIAKLIVGKSFGGCVRYLLEREQSKVLDSAGVRDYDSKTIIADLNAQRKLRPQLGNAVGHLTAYGEIVKFSKLPKIILKF